MRTKDAPAAYDRLDQQELRREIESELNDRVHRKDKHIDLAGNAFYIIMTSPNGTRYAFSVSNAGAAVFTAL